MSLSLASALYTWKGPFTNHPSDPTAKNAQIAETAQI